ncbi:glycosyltransferase [Arthrobacter sp. YA7-1]|uniref:glycosyltransferase family 2 protein n=1 Tax=Arthrobacter sp. YA7-1 TaxID=2987701 RepID=UPI002227AFDB|nr:glycosyltransferase family 2 protein [Arthrobacter sp. YA7-1]UYY80861.1 glycosyltransferase [Arthrobacter sp. YA7-1]
MKILIAVLTYDREIELELCLESIGVAIENVNVSVDVVIGDNKPGSNCVATHLLCANRVQMGFGSISAGRQFLLNKARVEGYGYIAFIDDDEVVSPTWLARMLETAKAHQCAAVAGPVTPVGLRAADLPLHARKRHATGTIVPSAGAGNLLLDLNRAKVTDFNLDWGLAGGEDTDFTLRLSANEGPIVWCDEGEAFEPVAANRLSRRWLIRRYFSNGRILYRAQRSLTSVPDRLPARTLALAFSSFQLLILPFSTKAFRYFLDHGARNLGYAYEALVGGCRLAEKD